MDLVNKIQITCDLVDSSSHCQISFFSRDPSFVNVSREVINLPASSRPENLNSLVNTISVQNNEKWDETNFDFLIDGVPFRASLSEHANEFCLSTEDVIKIECIHKECPPHPRESLADSDWVSGLKASSVNQIFSVNYSGELAVWSGSEQMKKAAFIKLEDGPLKCLDVFEDDSEMNIVVGGHDQTLKWLKYSAAENNFITLAQLRNHERTVECVAVNKDAKRAASGSFDKCLKIWKLKQESKCTPQTIEIKTPMVTLKSHKEAIVGVKWNPLDASQVATVSWDHCITLWDLLVAGPCQTLNSSKAFTSLSMNATNGFLITSSTDPVIRLWDFRSSEGSMVKQSFLGHLGWVTSVCWAPSSEYLFASSSFDKTVKMWDIRSQRAALYDLIGHEDRVLAVDWSVEQMICSGSADCSIKTFLRKG